MTAGHIVAMGGWEAEEDGALADFVLALADKGRPRMCYVPTAGAENEPRIAAFFETFAARTEPSVLRLFGVPRPGIRDFLLEQDVIWVAGGNTANMLAVWRVHGVDDALREAWENGAVLAGWSAGAICWFEGGITDSFGPELAPLRDGLGLLAGTFCPHYDSEEARRGTYLRLVEEGLAAGYAADDGVGLHFRGTELVETVGSRAGGRAFRVERGGDGVTETALPVRHLD
ncbi:MAG: peptidase E [Actinomycetota bacterium]|nr:peptidase E [Actinomycetota bacterium]